MSDFPVYEMLDPPVRVSQVKAALQAAEQQNFAAILGYESRRAAGFDDTDPVQQTYLEQRRQSANQMDYLRSVKATIEQSAAAPATAAPTAPVAPAAKGSGAAAGA